MEELIEIQKITIIHAQKNISGHKAAFIYTYSNEGLFDNVQFNIFKNIQNEGPDSEPNKSEKISGKYIFSTGKLEVSDNNLKDGDLNLYQEIIDTCKGIYELKNNSNEPV